MGHSGTSSVVQRRGLIKEWIQVWRGTRSAYVYLTLGSAQVVLQRELSVVLLQASRNFIESTEQVDGPLNSERTPVLAEVRPMEVGPGLYSQSGHESSEDDGLHRC